MSRVKSDSDVPRSADARLDELAQILARGMLRLVTKKSGSDRGKRLDFSSKTRLSVTNSNASTDREVT